MVHYIKKCEKESECLLGVHIQRGIKWTEQVDLLYGNLMVRLEGVAKLRRIMSFLS